MTAPFALLAVVLFASSSPPPAESTAAAPTPQQPKTDNAAAAAATLKQSLLTALQKALKAGGPVAAVAVCGDVAARVKHDVTTPTLSIGRTSSRLRNPSNVAPDWVRPLLAELEAAPADQRGPRRVALPGGATGYVEPLVTAPLCLQCHGDAIAPDVHAVLLAKYPQDKAVGFRAGDLRGVVWVEQRGTGAGSPPQTSDPNAPRDVSDEPAPAAIRDVVRAHLSEVRTCFELALKHAPKLAGKITARWVIAEDGSVTDPTIASSELDDTALHACIVKQIATWKFPPAGGGGPRIVNYPFALQPAA